jgi:DNA mismatch repair protein MutS
VDEPPISVKEGGMIRSGLNVRLDYLRKQIGGGKDWMAELEKNERERTGINSLKVRYNQVFGFYIEVSKANVHLAPKNYMRKQTLVNGERFITPDLKQQEDIILTAEEELCALEYQLFSETLTRVLSHTPQLQQASKAIKTVFIGIGALFVGIIGIVIIIAFFNAGSAINQTPNGYNPGIINLENFFKGK